MDLLSLGIIFVILAASGGIAFIADGLGKKIGKKRISVRFGKWSLRPKHVASLGTVAMGVVVSALTIGFIAAVSRDAREWLKQGGRLLVQRDELQENVKIQKAQLSGLNRQLNDFNRTIRDDRLLIGKVQDELGLKRKDAKDLDLRVKGLDAELKSKNVSLGEAKVELAERQRAIDTLQLQLPKLRERVAMAQRQVQETNLVLTSVNRRLAVAQGDLKTAEHNTQVAHLDAEQAKTKSNETYKENLALNVALDEEVKTRKDLVANLKAEAAELVAQREDAQAQADAAQARYGEVRSQLEGADKELIQMQEALRSQAIFLNGGFKTSRLEAMTYRRGEEVARIVVPAGSDVETARAKLDALLRLARIDAEERGAKSHRAGGQTFEAADIVERKDPKTGAVADADILKRSLVASLADRPGDQVLVATSSLNAFVGEPVSLDLEPMPNPVVYKRNAMVAETRIDGGQSDEQIIADLSKFVNGTVRQNAAKDHMIPRAGTSAPYGEPSAYDIVTLLQNVRKAGRSVRVQALAGDDIRAADPLRLEFKVH